MDFLSWAASVWGSLTAPAQVAVKIWDDVSDPYLWRSLAWIGLGAALLLMGISLWLRAPQFALRSTIGSASPGDLARLAK